MRKILKASVLGILSLALVGTGVYAAVLGTKGLDVTNNVNFQSTDVYVDIAASSTLGTNKTYLHTADLTEKVSSEPAAWSVGTVSLTNDTDSVAYTFTFTNRGDKRVKITFTKPTLEAPLAISGGLRQAGEPASYSGDTVTLERDGSAEFQYTVYLTAYNRNVSAAANFTVQLEAAAEAA